MRIATTVFVLCFICASAFAAPVIVSANEGRNEINLYGADGAVLGSLSAPAAYGYPTAAAFDEDGNVWAADFISSKLYKFDNNGNYVATYSDASLMLSGVTGLAFDGDTLWVANRTGGQVCSLSLAGGAPGAADCDISIANARSVAVGNGYLYVSASGGTHGGGADVLNAYSLSTGALVYSVAVTNPRQIAIDAAGNVYVTGESDSSLMEADTIYVFTSTLGTIGADSVFASSPDGVGINGLAFDSLGNLYASNYMAGTISRFDSTGLFTGYIVTGAGAYGPSGLALHEMDMTDVPEPSAFLLTPLGLAGLIVVRRRRRA